jgi:hypothetical protein
LHEDFAPKRPLCSQGVELSGELGHDGLMTLGAAEEDPAGGSSARTPESPGVGAFCSRGTSVNGRNILTASGRFLGIPLLLSKTLKNLGILRTF